MCCAVRVPTDSPSEPAAPEAAATSAATSASPTSRVLSGSTTTASGVVDRARGDLQSGRSWKARDRLAGHVIDHRDPEALDLLGQVYYDMGDLPAAGAVWFGSARRGADVDQAVAAWRERHGDHFGQMWRSIPRSMRAEPRTPKLEALRAKAIQQDTDEGRLAAQPPERRPLQPSVHDADGGIDAAKVIAWILAAAFVACGVIGLVTVLQWMVTG